MCKLAAAQLAKTTRSRYKGMRLYLAKSAMKQTLPVFSELLDEVVRSWIAPTAAEA